HPLRGTPALLVADTVKSGRGRVGRDLLPPCGRQRHWRDGSCLALSHPSWSSGATTSVFARRQASNSRPVVPVRAGYLMLVQAIALALLASLSPTALLITAVYLGSAEPRRTALAYLAGATVMSLVTGVVILEILRNTGLSHPAEHGPRYGFRLGLGLLLLVAGAVV